VIKSNLGALGLGVDVREFPLNKLFERATTRGEPYDIITAHWAADYADPSDFLNVLLHQQIESRGNLNLSYLTGAQLASQLERVARLTGEARYRAYEKLSAQMHATMHPGSPTPPAQRATSSPLGWAASSSILSTGWTSRLSASGATAVESRVKRQAQSVA